MVFDKESKFEQALITHLTEKSGWEKEVLRYKDEKELLKNWADILFQRNNSIDKLNDCPLTETEMNQILEQINRFRTPFRLNEFINGRTVTICRDNPDDKLHFKTEISLDIYNPDEISGGKTRYQIAQQPRFNVSSSMYPDARGDFSLLINGMPLIHVELKRTGVAVSHAYDQIQKYMRHGVFSGLFSLVQIFVIMNPDETKYFANPGPDGKFLPEFSFHWGDFYNEPINEWNRIADTILRVPLVHQLIGYYSVADKTDGILKIMRSYQFNAVNEIVKAVIKHTWDNDNQRGGYIWHTTGSGKTITSFKTAQRIANSKYADKVIFLVDRVELNTQSYTKYNGFCSDADDIQNTESTSVLVQKLSSDKVSDKLIITSIQKLSNIDSQNDYWKLNKESLYKMTDKRIVFIVDECHRSTFGEMMYIIKQTFKKAVFFGFTGTPIAVENERKGSTTADVFGKELHRYSISDGIRDKNVLGFDIDGITTFDEKKMREKVALEKAKAKDIDEAYSNPRKESVFLKYMFDVPMAGYEGEKGSYTMGIEDYMLDNDQYNTKTHRKMVVKSIVDNWLVISHNKKFHGIFATSSIPEAIKYYVLIKDAANDLKVTALFDPSLDGGWGEVKENALIKIISDYNDYFDKRFTLTTYNKMKTDIQNRLAHIEPYKFIASEPEKQIDLLIVVDQMLTGFDSKWVNVLYLDKMMQYANIIQAFSRTNRVFSDHDKPFGIIKYYRAPNTMKRFIDKAVKLYSGDKPFGLFVDKLEDNLKSISFFYNNIKKLFENAGIYNFVKLPEEEPDKKQFSKWFKTLSLHIDAAKIQGLKWSVKSYKFGDEKEGFHFVELELTEEIYDALLARYKELFSGSSGVVSENVEYDLDGYLYSVDTTKIDAEYMNSHFKKWLEELGSSDPKVVADLREQLVSTFSSLNQEEQKYAHALLIEIESGKITVDSDKGFRSYINEYMIKSKNTQVHRLAEAFGLDEKLLAEMTCAHLDEKSIDEFGRFTELKETWSKDKILNYYETLDKDIPPVIVLFKAEELLRKFIIAGGFEI